MFVVWQPRSPQTRPKAFVHTQGAAAPGGAGRRTPGPRVIGGSQGGGTLGHDLSGVGETSIMTRWNAGRRLYAPPPRACERPHPLSRE